VTNDELQFVEALVRRLPPAPPGETWIGDDAAVLRSPAGCLLLAADAVVEGRYAAGSMADLGWTALARNVSDIAAMGGRPLHAVVTVVVPPGRGEDLDALYDGLGEAADALGCPIVGGDLTGGPVLVVTVAITGTVDGTPVLRSGARPGDVVFVTGPLGAAKASGWRPGRLVPRVAEGDAARRGGATAMIDVSDGLALDLRRLAAASGVRVVVDDVPVATGASREDAMTGGEDYELALCGPADLGDAFAGLRPPIAIGRVVEGSGVEGLPEGGWRHEW